MLIQLLEAASRPKPGRRLLAFCLHPDGVTVEKTPYGLPVAYLTADEFLRAVPAEIEDRKGKAARAYVAELLPETEIALYFH